MRFKITAVSESEKSKLWEALQNYLAELSKLGGRPALNGVFPYRYFNAYWDEPDRWPFWIKSEDEIAGFALVRKRDDGAFEMAEFYVRPEYRRSGIGAGSARALFARFPGRWHLSEFKENTAAIAFWRRVLQDFSAYAETVGTERVEQSFNSN
jgi:predicted acetyltransferase